MRGLLIVAAAAMSVGACAGGREIFPKTSNAADERGHQIAQRKCAACHAVEVGRQSPRPGAPPFASIEMRHTAGLEGRLADLTTHGHYEMPTVRLTPRETADLYAYIERFDAP
jgi:cytochrome c